MINFTNLQARHFLLLKHGLLDNYRFIGKQGAYDYVRQCGCIQFDPVDVCGKNAELVLQSRVKGFTKQTLDELLYTDRKLVDFPDKNLSIFPVEDWPYFSRYRSAAKKGGMQFPELAELEAWTKEYIRINNAVSSDDLPLEGSMHWHSSIHWSGAWDGQTKAARAVLEQLYSTGELVIHHKNGTRKFYDLIERHISEDILNAPDPLPDEFEHQKWRVLRRIGAVGLLWNRPSDAWLNIWGLNTAQREKAFSALLDEGKILAIQVEGINAALYSRAEDLPIIETVLKNQKFKPRCELLAPLDCMMWDRKLIKTLFGFQYSWEIYTPQDKRKYGFYTLPMIYGDRFIGRVEAVNDRKSKTLVVKNVWFEDGAKRTKALLSAVDKCLNRFAVFNECQTVVWINEDQL